MCVYAQVSGNPTITFCAILRTNKQTKKNTSQNITLGQVVAEVTHRLNAILHTMYICIRVLHTLSIQQMND